MLLDDFTELLRYILVLFPFSSFSTEKHDQANSNIRVHRDISTFLLIQKKLSYDALFVSLYFRSQSRISIDDEHVLI